MKPMTSAATQAVVTAMASVSAEYMGGPSREAPTTGPVEGGLHSVKWKQGGERASVRAHKCWMCIHTPVHC